MQRIIPFLWLNNNAEEAVNFYTSLFSDSKTGNIVRYNEAAAEASGMPKDSVMTVVFELAGQGFMALNGGPVFSFTQAISFFVSCETQSEIDSLWSRLSEDSPKIFWPLQKYPWSEKYGWLTDKFGLSWQLILSHSPQKIIPFFMFDGDQLGKARDAIDFYTSVFKNSRVESVQQYGPENKASEGLIVNSVFTLNGQLFMAMDSGMPKNVNFNESVSFLVSCENQEEIDYFWENLSSVPESEQCGWLKDKFGISWQIVPVSLPDLLDGSDPVRAERVMESIRNMKKIDMQELQRIYDRE